MVDPILHNYLHDYVVIIIMLSYINLSIKDSNKQGLYLRYFGKLTVVVKIKVIILAVNDSVLISELEYFWKNTFLFWGKIRL